MAVTCQQAIDILTSQGKFYINLGLERVQAILKILGNPEQKLKFIHVAGTNGKGSVCAMLSAVLAQSELVGRAYLPDKKKLKVGLFTSPHVFEYTERIKINDIEIEKEIFAKKIINIVELAEKNNIHLTEFEIITGIAFEYFAEQNVDIVVLETGLGGRLDATNVIKENICSIITHLDLDHTERLGETIEKIAFEKAGIIKENCPVVVSEKNLGFKVITKIAQEQGSKIIEPKHNNKLTKINSLRGKYQEENLSLVLAAIEILNNNGIYISEETIIKGLKNVKHQCRFEYLKEQNIIIDGAHNPNGTKVLRESLDEYFPNQNFRFIFGCLNNKDYPQMMSNLFTSEDEIYFYQFDYPNACKYEELASVCEFNSKPLSALKNFKKGDNTLTVICGSFYMIKELLTKMGIK